MPPTCIHRKSGLCPMCQADYEEDPMAWLQYGLHPAGIARWNALREEMAAEAAKPVEKSEPDPNIPF